MNSISISKFKEVKGKIREEWGNITDSELEITKGNVEQIIGKIESKYDDSKKDIRKKINKILIDFKESL